MFKVYFVGTPVSVKGIDDFHVLAQSLEGVAGFYWFCWQISDTMRKRYSKINFITGLSDASLKRQTKEMDILVSCSYYEGFCLPIAEAMLNKKPVIAYALSELLEVYGDSVHFVEVGDVSAVKDRLLHLLDTPASSGALDRAYFHIQENYSPSAVSARLLKIFFNE